MSNQIAENFANSYFAHYSKDALGQTPYKVNFTTTTDLGNQIFTIENLIPSTYIMIIYAAGYSGGFYSVSNFVQPFVVIANTTSTLETALYNVSQWNIPNSYPSGPISLVAGVNGVTVQLVGSTNFVTEWTISIELISAI